VHRSAALLSEAVYVLPHFVQAGLFRFRHRQLSIGGDVGSR
jgi:hypothetical protein